MLLLSIKLSFTPVLSWSTNIKTINNKGSIAFRDAVDEYRASECRARLGSYCTWFRKVPCSMYNQEIICLAWGISLLCNENFRTWISSGAVPVLCLQKTHNTVTPSYIHTAQFCIPTAIPCSYTVPQSYIAVLQLYNNTLQLCISTVIPVVIQLHSHTMQVDSYVIMRIYIFLKSYTTGNTVLKLLHAVTQFYNHYMQIHSSTIITRRYTVRQSFRELQFYSNSVQL